MCGGIIVQKYGDFVEVMEYPSSLSRCWRAIEFADVVQEGDEIWWYSKTGYLSRKNKQGNWIFRDKNVGKCQPCNPFGRKSA